MLDCPMIYTGNPCAASLSLKRAVSAADSQDSGMHPGNPGAGRGGTRAAEGNEPRHCFAKALWEVLQDLGCPGRMRGEGSRGCAPRSTPSILGKHSPPCLPLWVVTQPRGNFSGGLSFLQGNSKGLEQQSRETLLGSGGGGNGGLCSAEVRAWGSGR